MELYTWFNGSDISVLFLTMIIRSMRSHSIHNDRFSTSGKMVRVRESSAVFFLKWNPMFFSNFSDPFDILFRFLCFYKRRSFLLHCDRCFYSGNKRLPFSTVPVLTTALVAAFTTLNSFPSAFGIVARMDVPLS